MGSWTLMSCVGWRRASRRRSLQNLQSSIADRSGGRTQLTRAGDGVDQQSPVRLVVAASPYRRTLWAEEKRLRKDSAPLCRVACPRRAR